MSLKLLANSNDRPLGALISAHIINAKGKVKIEVTLSEEFKSSSNVKLLGVDSNVVCDSNNEVGRYFGRMIIPELYGGNDICERTQVDHWLSFSIGPLKSQKSIKEALIYLDNVLKPKTWLVSKHLTLADIYVFASLVDHRPSEREDESYCNVNRWCKQMLSMPEVQRVLASIPKSRASGSGEAKSLGQDAKRTCGTGNRKQEGKFIELPGAIMGKVVVRFPPEASGFLHIGHAKAALLNQYYAEAFEGQLIMRFDDTNPAKENVEFEQAILQDLEMLQIKPDRFTHSSDYFDLMLSYCDKLIKERKAFVDDTPALLMKEQREQRLPSVNRENSIEKNTQLWEEMKNGTARGQECCVRAKIDYQSTNGCMRDPTIYRCKPEPHPRTGTKYKVYPTYDFACPIVDAVEGVTHTLRTTEYHDRDVQFYWLIEALDLRRPYIWEYSRLNMTNTVLSKRRLTWLVAEGLVDGWDDPRFPTVRGILRRGMTVDGLKQFIIAQGSSRSVVFMEWDKIWSFNKKVIDPIAIRYTALNADEIVPVYVEGATENFLTAQNHPKDPAKGTKEVRIGLNLIIEKCDAETLVEGENATFINWGNLMVRKIEKKNGVVTGVVAKYNIANKDYKNTIKLTWLAADNNENEVVTKQILLPCYAVYFEHIISKAVLGKDEDFKDFVARNTRKEVKMLAESEMKRVKKGEIIQLQRKGFFRCDVPYAPPSPFSSREQPIVLFHIPDGHSTAQGTTNTPVASERVMKNKKDDKKDVALLSEKITVQGNKVREVKAAKADKPVIDVEVKILLGLKAEYKGIVGADWKPEALVKKGKSEEPSKVDAVALSIKEQGDKVRQLKTGKAEKKIVDQEVKDLLALKAEYKKLTGKDWKLGEVTQALITPVSSQMDDAVLSLKVQQQGERIRQLKAEKADKKTIDPEVENLLALRAEYKSATGKHWTPEVVQEASVSQQSQKTDVQDLSNKIQQQGDKVRQLKTEKADKKIIDQSVKGLLALKSDYKSTTGEDWKPFGKMSNETTASLSDKVTQQGEKVRQLKSQKAEKIKIDEEVKELLRLKADYKSQSGQEWIPEASTNVTTSVNQSTNELSNEISKQGDKVRELKCSKADKAKIDEAVKILIKLKNNYKVAAGHDWKPPEGAESVEARKKNPAHSRPTERSTKKEKPKEQRTGNRETESNKTGTRLGLEAKKNENLSDWYSQVITKGEMIEYYEVSGCYILRPWSFSIWDVIKDYIDREIKKFDVQNCYFPIFVSKSVLEREKDHIADFAPEVAWVTKSGESELAEPIAIRPTSETVMYPSYAKWLKSYRDLPLKLNQWNNVVRWEFKHPQPFLRTREFLWQEGHSAFATKDEADEEVLTILDIYARVYEEFLAVPVVKGRKTEKEKFAGGDYTTTVEAFVSASGRAIQGATSHHLGQNFSRMFDIQVEGADEGGEKTFVYQNSWGLTTRTIGVMIMVHGDDKGLVLPPKVAAVQAIIIPCGITASTSLKQREHLMTECSKLEAELRKSGEVKVKGDYRDNYSPGWKFNHWELKGVPVRVELGFKDLEKKQVTLVRRDNSERLSTNRADIVDSLNKLLEDIQTSMLARATKDLTDHIKHSNDWKTFCTELDKKNILLAPFCGDMSCEDSIKADSMREDAGDEAGAPSMGAKSLCIPFEQPKKSLASLKCVHPSCTRKPKFYTLFGRSY